jgi:hypothetical protein
MKEAGVGRDLSCLNFPLYILFKKNVFSFFFVLISSVNHVNVKGQGQAQANDVPVCGI